MDLKKVVSQLFEVTVAADGSELSSRYHRHKKQLRQSATMAEVSSDAWVCPSCSYNNQDYQRFIGPGCDEVRPGSLLDTSEFTLTIQPPPGNRRSIETGRRHYPAMMRKQMLNLSDNFTRGGGNNKIKVVLMWESNVPRRH